MISAGKIAVPDGPAEGRDTGLAKKLHIKTYGCQMNVYDSARMADVLASHGYEETASAVDADLVILTTCHIREKASEKVFSELGRLAAEKRLRASGDRPLQIGVAGCVAQAEGEEIARRAPAVDVVVGPQSYHRLGDLLSRPGEGARLDTEFPADSKFDALPKAVRARGPAAFLTVQEGCDKFCTFCVVPYTRGAEASRPAAAVEAEARALVAAGVREITLLGQNVNAYRDPGTGLSFGALLRRIAAIEGLSRLRYTTSHPLDVDEAQVAAHRDVPKVMPFLHLPVQSGSDSVLAAMNRRHRADDYRLIVERLRRARPDLALSSDFIVGFPGESEADFEATLALVRDVGFAQAYSFKYSARPGTPAAAGGAVPEAVKAERLARLQALLDAQRLDFNRAFEGRTVEVLLEHAGARPGQLMGRSAHMQSVHMDAPGSMIGALVRVRVVGAYVRGLAAALDDDIRTPSPVRSDGHTHATGGIVG